MIAILTDFGNSEYLGIMKGVILSIKNNAIIIDLYNNVSPLNSIEAAWILLNAYKHFPKNTVFLCVVDPGVGSERKPLAIKTTHYFFVGPDNGLMYPAATDDRIEKIITLPIPKESSKTFHGRDIFAKAAASLENSTLINNLGEETKEILKLNFHLNEREGEIVRIDHFGNIITNIPPLNKDQYTIQFKNKEITVPFYKTYDEAKNNTLFLITGSCNTLEFSVKKESANKKLNATTGERITIT